MYVGWTTRNDAEINNVYRLSAPSIAIYLFCQKSRPVSQTLSTPSLGWKMHLSGKKIAPSSHPINRKFPSFFFVAWFSCHSIHHSFIWGCWFGFDVMMFFFCFCFFSDQQRVCLVSQQSTCARAHTFTSYICCIYILWYIFVCRYVYIYIRYNIVLHL